MDPPVAFKYWDDFDDQMKMVLEYVKRRKETKYENYIQPNSEKSAIYSHFDLLLRFIELG